MDIYNLQTQREIDMIDSKRERGKKNSNPVKASVLSGGSNETSKKEGTSRNSSRHQLKIKPPKHTIQSYILKSNSGVASLQHSVNHNSP